MTTTETKFPLTLKLNTMSYVIFCLRWKTSSWLLQEQQQMKEENLLIAHGGLLLASAKQVGFFKSVLPHFCDGVERREIKKTVENLQIEKNIDSKAKNFITLNTIFF